MAASLDQTPRLHLAVDDSMNNNRVASTVVVWNPSNILRGNLEITSETSFEFVEATIFLEGISRNWISEAVGNEIPLRISTTERIFLSQTMDVSSSMVGLAAVVPGGFHLDIPFNFIISMTVANSSSASPLQCLKLPPSVELGGVYIDDSSGKRYAQPSISYQVRAAVALVGLEQGPEIHTSTSTPIVITPHNEELPPTDTMDFPTEFKLKESRTIRSSPLGRTLGTMVVSMQEPRALFYDSSSTGASTLGFLDIVVELTGTDNVYQSLQAMSFKVLSLLRAKTFYSVKAFPQLPSQSLLGTNGGTRLRDDMIKLETRNMTSLRWGYTYDIADYTMVSNTAKPHKTRSENFPLQSSPQSNPSAPPGKWSAKLSYPINVDSRLLPTFCSSIVARLYSVILRVKVSGIRKESFDLEVPLQVVHTSPGTLSNVATQDFEGISGVVGENPSFPGLRRSSLASWFSDESLESEERPPRYHP